MGNDRCLGARHLSKLPLWLPHFIGADYLWGQKNNFTYKIIFLPPKIFASSYNIGGQNDNLPPRVVLP